MPSVTTHYLFAKEVYNHLNKKEKSLIEANLPIYYTFAQSHDFLFYYTFDLKNFKRIRNLGHSAHHNKTQDYLVNIIKEIKNNHLEYDSSAISYLYGSITHYVLDTTCHPFIFYKTGIYRKEIKNSKIYRGEHTRMEKHIDAIYCEKYFHKKYNHCNLNKDIIRQPNFSNTLKELINTVYSKTYEVNNIAEFYYKSIIHTKIINSLLINDYFGLKKFIYILIDKITNHHFGNLSSYSTHILKPDKSFLNEEHLTWYHPSIKEKSFNYSFHDLFEISLQKSIKIIKEVNKVLYSNKDISIITKYIPNIDYATGLEIKNNLRMNYFEKESN